MKPSASKNLRRIVLGFWVQFWLKKPEGLEMDSDLFWNHS
jgi:hypothetical protein